MIDLVCVFDGVGGGTIWCEEAAAGLEGFEVGRACGELAVGGCVGGFNRMPSAWPATRTHFATALKYKEVEFSGKDGGAITYELE